MLRGVWGDAAVGRWSGISLIQNYGNGSGAAWGYIFKRACGTGFYFPHLPLRFEFNSAFQDIFPVGAGVPDKFHRISS